MTTIAPFGITMFRDCRARKPEVHASALQVLQSIKDGLWRHSIESIRLASRAEQRMLKEALKAVTFAGEFTVRNNMGCVSLSGLVCLDFDHIEDPAGLRDSLATSEHCYGAFISPSGEGVKALFTVEPPLTSELTPAEAQNWYAKAYQQVHRHALKLTGVEADPAPKALASLCFVSWDPDTHINLKPTRLEVQEGPQEEMPKQDYKGWFAQVVAKMHAGYSLESIDAWSREGAKYQEGEIKPIWEWFHAKQDTPTEQQASTAATRPWITVGLAAAKALGKEKFAYDPVADGGNGWFYRRINQHWQLVPKRGTHILMDLVHLQAAQVEEYLAGDEKLTKMFRECLKAQRTELSSDFWTGLRAGLLRQFEELPQDIVPLNNGLLDLTKVHPELTAHSPDLPYRVTAVATGNYRDEIPRETARAAVRLALNPAMPDSADQDKLLWALAQALSGRAGGAARGSVIALVGEGGSGKGWIIRYAQRAFGALAVSTSQGSLAPRFETEINAGLAEIVERNARLITLGEANNLRDLRNVNMLTGGDTITTRKPYGPLVTGQVRAALIYAAPTIPQGNIISGLWRRLMPIFLPGNVAKRYPAACKDEASPAEVDALTTYLCHLAHDLAGGAKPAELWDTPPSIAEYAKASDMLIDWLASKGQEYSGTAVEAAYMQFLNERPAARENYATQRGFSRACNSHEVRTATGWQVKREKRDGSRTSRLIL